MRVNGLLLYIKPICVNNLTVLMGLRVHLLLVCAPPSRGIFITYMGNYI